MAAFARTTVLCFLLIQLVFGDVYMHNPRGSNNRLHRDRNNDPNNRQTENANRLFDSQDNNNGGYDWAGEDGAMLYYEGSVLELEWAAQHGCGNDYAHNDCEIIWQYMCGTEVRDGTSTGTPAFDPNQPFAVPSPDTGMHEDNVFYAKCYFRERNTGLFLADQDDDLNGNSAIYTRQNNNGNRHGYECPEERDYYPYWHPSPWVDIAILTSNTERCAYYQAESGNVQSKGECLGATTTATDMWMYNEPVTCQNAGGRWVQQPPRAGLTAPVCIEAPYQRENHLGNARAGTIDGVTYGGNDNAFFRWTLPTVAQIESAFGVGAAQNCVVRLRYNMSSTDYDGWSTFSDSSGYMYSPVINDPWADYGWPFLLRLAVDSTQFARTFQDRSHTLSVLPRPATVNYWTRLGGSGGNNQVKRQTYSWQGGATGDVYAMTQSDVIHNLNVIGRRGNLIQTYPAEQYGFRPRVVRMRRGEFLHPQWTGTNFATQNAEGEGTRMYDRHGLIQIHSLKENLPVNFSNGEQYLFEPRIAWDLAFGGIYSSTGAVNTNVMISSLSSSLCPSLSELQVRYQTDANGNTQTVRQVHDDIRTDPFNCAKLSGTTSPHYNGPLIRMMNTGTYYAMDPRNNAPGMSSVKVTIIVED